MTKLPVRLRKDPIVEAVAEIRFVPTGGKLASKLLPGLIYGGLPHEYPEGIELPAAQIPSNIRDVDPVLRHTPLFHLRGADATVLVGDRVLGVTTNGPYPGWGAFKPKVLAILELACTNEIFSVVERISVKYVNLIERIGSEDHLGLTTTRLSLGENQIKDEVVQIKVENRVGNKISVVQLASHALITSHSGSEHEGLVIDIDAICNGPFTDFSSNMSDLLDEAHQFEKEIFYSLLTQETLNRYEPEY